MTLLTAMPYVKIQFFDNNGDPANGCKLFTYVAGGSTKQNTYIDSGQAVANSNPIVLDSAGRASIFWLPTTYDVVLAPSTDTDPPTSPIWSMSGVAATASFSGANLAIDVTGKCAAGTIAVDNLVALTGSNWAKVTASQAVTHGVVGWVTSQISTSANSGTIRLIGTVTSAALGFAVGSDLYVDTVAGALTTTAGTNQRSVGQMTDTNTMAFDGFGGKEASSTLAGLVGIGAQTWTGVKTMTSPAWAGLPTGIGAFVTSYAASNTTKNNNTTLIDVTGLSFAVLANSSYAFQFVLHLVSAAAADIKTTLTGPAAPTAVRFGTNSGAGSGVTSAAAFASNLTISTNGNDETYVISGQLRNGANAGTVQLQFAQAAADVSNSVIYAESSVMAWRIA